MAFAVSVLSFMMAYLTGIGALSEGPTLLVLALVFVTVLRLLVHNSLRVATEIRWPFVWSLALAGFLFAKHVVVTGGDLFFLIKLFSYHLVFASGLLIGFYEPPTIKQVDATAVVALLLVPMVFFLIFARGQDANQIVSFFNRNAHAGHTIVASVALLGVASGRPLVGRLTYFGIVLACLVANTTLGALLAVLVGISLYFLVNMTQELRRRALIIFAATLFMIGLGATFLASGRYQDLIVFERLRFVVGTARNIWEGFSGSLLELDLVTAVGFAADGELDMSAFFRVIHWIDIVKNYLASGSNISLGGGTDWIEQNRLLFVIPRAAHNDILRLVVEQGIIFSALVFAGIAMVLWQLRHSIVFVPLFAGALYFGTENLLNNFVATSFYFFVLGQVYGRFRQPDRSGMPAGGIT